MISDDSHHWIGETPDPSMYFGFVYELHHLTTGFKYVGYKQFWGVNSGVVKKNTAYANTNRRSAKWKAHHWKPSNWRHYKGSSVTNQEFFKEHRGDWEYTIVSQQVTLQDCKWAEAALMHYRGVGVKRDEDGELVYLNGHIPALYGAVSEYYNMGPLSEDARDALRARNTTEKAIAGRAAHIANGGNNLTTSLGVPHEACGTDLYYVTRDKRYKESYCVLCKHCDAQKKEKSS